MYLCWYKLKILETWQGMNKSESELNSDFDRYGEKSFRTQL